MSNAQKLLLPVGCLLGIISSCSNSGGGTTTNPITAGTGVAPAGGTGTTPAAGTGAVPTGGRGPAAAGTSAPVGTAGTGVAVAGTSAPVGTGGTGVATAGTGVAAAGTSAPATGGAGAPAGGSGGGASGGMCMGSGPALPDGMCKSKSSGVYAMKVDVDVWWRDENNTPTLYDPGRGTITIYLKGDLPSVCDDGKGQGIVQTCGSLVPPLLADANCGVIQIVFPDDMWEKPGMAKIMTAGSTTGFNPNDVLSFAKGAGIYGIELSDPAATWPTYEQTPTFACASGTAEKCFPDSDGDMNPGITVQLKQDGTPTGQPYTCIAAWTYIPAPISVPQAALDPQGGVSETYIGLRTAISGGGKIGADCASGSGPAEASAFESRLIDCKLKSGTKCTADNAKFVDQNLPNFHVLMAGQMPPAEWKHPRPEADRMLNRMPSKGPIGSVVRIADPGATVTCAQVRMATFPAGN